MEAPQWLLELNKVLYLLFNGDRDFCVPGVALLYMRVIY